MKRHLNVSRKQRQISIKLMFFVLCLGCQSAYPTTYYFSSVNGNDAYSSLQAQNLNTPWRSLAKLNTYFDQLSAGDSVLFKRGEEFDGMITVHKSGFAFAPIYLGAYGKGNKPEINGSVTLLNWRKSGTGVYESECHFVVKTLSINGLTQHLGRYPNKGYLSYEAHHQNFSITDHQLNASTNWTGAEVVIKKNRWILDKASITNQTGGTISYEPGTTAVPTDNYGYFIQNDLRTLDEEGEWFYDAKRNTISVFVGDKSISSLDIKCSVANTLVELKGFNYVTFENLSFTGAGENSFHIVNSKNIEILNCEILYSGGDAVSASFSPFLTIENCLINYSLNGALNLDVGCTYAILKGNHIKNTGLFPGMGKSGSGTYEGITAFGDFTQIERNRIDSTGYCGIYFGGNSSIAKNNVINHFCLIKDDGAGIYLGDWSPTFNKSVIGNIILNGVGSAEGTNSPKSFQAEGIYIDDLTQSVTIADNTVTACANNGIKIHNSKDVKVYNNTVYNNTVQLRLEQDHYLSTSTCIRDAKIKNNVFFSGSDDQSTAAFSTHQDDIHQFGELDSNFYASPEQEAVSIKSSVYKKGVMVNQSSDLSGWQLEYGKDQSSKEAPVSLPTYKIDALIGPNKFSNGGFDTNIKGLYWYSSGNDCEASYHKGELDGGALKLSFKTLNPQNEVYVNLNIGKVSSDKKYILKFTMKGFSANEIFDTYLRETGSPYTILSNEKACAMKSDRTEYEVLFSAFKDENNASIIFELHHPEGEIYFDNVELYEADIKEVNPDDYLLFAYNDTDAERVINLSKRYVDVNNKQYSNEVSIKPYSSILLLAAGNEEPVVTPPEIFKEPQSVIFANLPSSIYENEPIMVSPVASSGLPVSLEVISGPAYFEKNILKFNSYGKVVIKAAQQGNEKFQPAYAEAMVMNSAKAMEIGLANSFVKTELKAYPNPFTNQLALKLTLKKSETGKLMLYNAQGQVIHQIYSGFMNKDEPQTFLLNTAGLGLVQGLYFVRLITNDEVLYQKVLFM